MLGQQSHAPSAAMSALEVGDSSSVLMRIQAADIPGKAELNLG